MKKKRIILVLVVGLTVSTVSLLSLGYRPGFLLFSSSKGTKKKESGPHDAGGPAPARNNDQEDSAYRDAVFIPRTATGRRESSEPAGATQPPERVSTHAPTISENGSTDDHAEVALPIELYESRHSGIRGRAFQQEQRDAGSREFRKKIKGGFIPMFPKLVLVGRNAQGYLEYDYPLGNGVSMRMVLLPGGMVTIGTLDDVLEKNPRITTSKKKESSPVEVEIEPFLIGKYEVTQRQWEAAMDRSAFKDMIEYVYRGDEGKYRADLQEAARIRELHGYSHKWAGGRVPASLACFAPDYPMHLTARTIFEFLEKTGLAIPNEGEWEYACRAGTRTALYTGRMTLLGAFNSPELDEIAWYGGNSAVDYRPALARQLVDKYIHNKYIHDVVTSRPGRKWSPKDWQTEFEYFGMHPVGQKKPNAFGLYDMIGNMLEWTATWDKRPLSEALTAYTTTGAGKRVPLRSPRDPKHSADYVFRGGSWMSEARYCRSSARRDVVGYFYKYPAVGLRAVWRLDDSFKK